MLCLHFIHKCSKLEEKDVLEGATSIAHDSYLPFFLVIDSKDSTSKILEPISSEIISSIQDEFGEPNEELIVEDFFICTDEPKRLTIEDLFEDPMIEELKTPSNVETFDQPEDMCIDLFPCIANKDMDIIEVEEN